MSSRNRALSIAAKVGLGAEELSKPCDDRLFPLLANFVHPWRLVFSSLLSEIDVDDVHRENSSEEEKRVAALRKWKARNGHEATYSVLVKAVLDHGKVDQAELICQLLAVQPHSEQESCEIPNSSLTRRSPLPPRPSTTPPLSSTTPATETLSPIATSLEEKIEQLDEEYTEIESLVLQTIKDRKVPHKTMLGWIQVLPMTLKSQFSELLQRNAKALSNASNVDKLFIIISPYWNSLHPTLLSHLVKKLADEKLKSRMKKYTDDLCKFHIHTRLGDLIEKWAGGVPPGFDEFVLELGEEWREKTVEDFEQFRIRLSRQQCIGGHMIYMKKVKPGSIFVELALPQCCFPLTFDRDMQEFLKEEDVLGVYMGGLCILDLHQAEEQISDSQSSDEDWEPEAEATAMDVAGTTGLSDSETDQSCDYSDDMDAMYDDQIPARTNDGEEAVAGGGVKAHDIIESSTTFPSLSSTNRMFLMKIPGDTSAKEFSLFRTNRLRRTGELELQLELKAGATSNDIEVGLERCMVGGGGHAGAIDPIRDSCCTFLASGAVFNYFKRNALVNINYPQDKALLSQGVSRIGLKITRDGALEFFVNGQSLGVAAEAVYKLGLWRLYHVTGMINYYPVLWLPTRCTTTLIAGACQTEVLSLQQMCIDKVAENLSYPRQVHLLRLPEYIKEKIVRVVFDPEVDFCRHLLDKRITHVDTIIDHESYKKLLSTTR